MVVVDFKYEDMKEMIDLPKEEIIEILSGLGAPSEFDPEIDKIITELTPNRPDWYSLEGLARGLRSYVFNKNQTYSVEKSSYKVTVDPKTSKVRPYTSCAVITGLEFNDKRIKDLVFLQEKLLSTLGRKVKKFGIGVYPLNAIAFPVDYCLMETKKISYTPLGHEEEMTADEIIEKHKKGKEYGHLIKGLEEYPVFIDAKKKIMALIPIVNSAETGKIDCDTTELFIEVTGIDKGACDAALNILCCAFADIGGIIKSVEVSYEKEKRSTPDLSEKEMGLDIEVVNRILGKEFNEKEIKSLLTKMGYCYRDKKVYIPPYRVDVIGIVDIIEDIAIAHGYGNFESTVPSFFTTGSSIRKYDEADNILRGMGFLEITTPILTNKKKLEKTGHEQRHAEITNPSSQEYTTLRPSIISDMLDVFNTNKMKGLPQKYYEIGVVYEKKTKKKVIFGIMDKTIDFADFRGYLQTLSKESGLEFLLKKEKNVVFEDKTSCVVISKNKKIGIFGKVKKEILEELGIEFDVYLCELSI